MTGRSELESAKIKYRDIYLDPLTPLNFLKRSEIVFPEKIAVVYDDHRYTWKEVAARIYSMANGLKTKGLARHDRAAILSRNNNAMLEAFYGIGLAGGVSVPLNYRLNQKDVAYMLNHSGSRVLFFERLFADTVREIMPELQTVKQFIEIDSPEKENGDVIGIPYEEFLKASSPEPVEIEVEDENDMLSIVYTSGTTGLPKGCVHTHRGAYLNALSEVIASGMNSASNYLWTLPMFHCEGWCFVWGVTAVGAKHVLLEAVRPEPVHRLMIAEKVTHMCGAPTVYSVLSDYMNQQGLKFPDTVCGFMGGAAPSLNNIEQAEKIGLDIHQVYGLTEVYGPHTLCEWHHDEWDKLPLEERARIKARQGVPYPTCTKVKVVDEDTEEVPHDGFTQGEIVMKGNNTMQWYFNDHEKTEEAFRGGWFHSGDAAVVHPDGYIEIVDRLKDLIVTGGENVSGIEVEHTIAALPGVADVAVFGKKDNKWGEIVKAIVTPRPGASITGEEIAAWCRQRLAGFKIPREIEFGEVPRTPTGKIQKNVLRNREKEKIAVS